MGLGARWEGLGDSWERFRAWRASELAEHSCGPGGIGLRPKGEITFFVSTKDPLGTSHRIKARPDEFFLGMKTRPDEFSLGMKTRPDESFLRMKFKIETELFFLLPVCSRVGAFVNRLEVPKEAKRYGLTKIGLISLFPLK